MYRDADGRRSWSVRRRVGSLRGLGLNLEPLRTRDYRLMFLGQLVGQLGRLVTQVALPYQLYVLTHSVVALGALAAVQLIGILAFALVGGALADTRDRRTLLMA